MIYVDTRQQKGKHKNIDNWFDAHGVEYEYKKLDFGDYQNERSNISIDTKQNMRELASNLGQDHERFKRECIRAKEANFRLIVLVEEHPACNNHALIDRWINPICTRCKRCNPLVDEKCKTRRFKPIQGKSIRLIMQRMTERYGVWFKFCKKSETAKKICELLGEEVKDA